MPRPLTAQVIRPRGGRQRSYALRVTAYGRRHYLGLGRPEQGWDERRARKRARQIVAEIKAGVWKPPTHKPKAKPQARDAKTADAYGLLRKAAQTLDARYRIADRSVRPDLGEALDAIYAAEDAIQRAIRLGE